MNTARVRCTRKLDNLYQIASCYLECRHFSVMLTAPRVNYLTVLKVLCLRLKAAMPETYHIMAALQRRSMAADVAGVIDFESFDSVQVFLLETRLEQYRPKLLPHMPAYVIRRMPIAHIPAHAQNCAK